MKTRTLLLLSVGTALMILLAGGVFLLQVAGQESATEPVAIGTATTVGDVEVTVLAVEASGPTLRVEVEVAGIDDVDGIASFRLVTGDQRLDPIAAPAADRCDRITVAAQQCAIDFDVSATNGTSRVLVLRRGDEQATWRLD